MTYKYLTIGMVKQGVKNKGTLTRSFLKLKISMFSSPLSCTKYASVYLMVI